MPARSGGRSIIDRPYLLLSLTSLFWAINIVLGRFIAGTIPPVTLSQIRWGGAALILLAISWRHVRRDWPVIRAHLPILLILGLTGMTLYNTMAYYGLNYTQALNALLMQSSGPLLVALWSLVLFRDRLTRAQLVGILISLLGVIVIITRGQPEVLLHLDAQSRRPVAARRHGHLRPLHGAAQETAEDPFPVVPHLHHHRRRDHADPALRRSNSPPATA